MSLGDGAQAAGLVSLQTGHLGVKRELRHLLVSPHLLEVDGTTDLKLLYECSLDEKRWKTVASDKVVTGAYCSDAVYKERILGINSLQRDEKLLEMVFSESKLDTSRGFCLDVGNLGVWSVSSAKESSTVENLRDLKAETFWQ